MKINITPRTLHFRQPAGTSRGIYTTRQIWLLTATDGEAQGIGECAPLPDLSCDALPDYDTILRQMCDIVEATGTIPYGKLNQYPSMLFGIETALLALKRNSNALFDTPFGRGEEGIPINGLVWMGTYEEMLARMEEKMRLGFRCIKLKIGAIDFNNELALIRRIRERFSKEEIELRVDANGAFSPEDALNKLEQLAKYDIHSIEQPIKQHQWEAMAELCRQSPLPIALDEELIGVNDTAQKQALLDTIRPAYIILKPSLHGGMCGTEEWIRLANERNIGSWITSALESNIGLNAIAHLTAHIYGSKISLPQGLGTGALFTDNIPMQLEIRGDELWHSPLVLLHTSGSTGKPKPMWVEKKRMEASARLTCSFLSLHEGDTALLCLPTDYIAGKMMQVRAELWKLRLTSVKPSGHPLAEVGEDGFDFAAMVPMQVYNSLQVPTERERLKRIRHLIIGGGAIDAALENELKDFPNNIWATYGMTETLSHIALRRVNGKDASLWFSPMKGVSISLNEDNCLVIDAPTVSETTIITNDIAELSPDKSRFRILGRKDNVICSGGIKIQIEEVERTLKPFISTPFLITKRHDKILGEAVTMLIEASLSAPEAKEDILRNAKNACVSHLNKYMQPRHYIAVDALPLTETGKPARKKAEEMAKG